MSKPGETEQLADLPNISRVIAGKLRRSGIETPDQLRGLGSREAFFRIRLQDPHACVNLLCALEGAVQGIRWFYLPPQVKAELTTYAHSLSGSSAGKDG